jgi:ribosome-binding protein aMBF1 (putative translation factor)
MEAIGSGICRALHGELDEARRVTLDNPTRAGRDRQDLASSLHDLRKASGLSGDRLARRCGMSQSKVSRIETGRLQPSVVDVEQVLTALEVDLRTSRAAPPAA